MVRGPAFVYKTLILLSFIGSAPALASSTVDTFVHDVMVPTQLGEVARILATADGRVYDLDSAHADLIASLIKAQAEHKAIRLTLDSAEHVTGLSELSGPNAQSDSEEFEQAVRTAAKDKDDTAVQPATIADSHGLGYQATNFSSMLDAQSLFDSLPQLRHNSQCFQRAHVWAYQMYNQRSVYSMKVFLFFTRAFIQQHHYKWWFHVAPFVYVQGQEIVLDQEFVDQPRTMHNWTDFFMMDQHFVWPALVTSPDCSEVASYSDYENNQMSQLCYTLKLPMYYYQPLDAENLAENGTHVESFRDWDLRNSRNAHP